MKMFTAKYGPWAVVTGASSGIGKAIAEQLAQQSINIVAVARNEKHLCELKVQLESDYQIKVMTLSLDLTRTQANEQLAAQTAHLDIGLLVASAGIENHGEYLTLESHNENALVALNVVSPMILTRIFAERFSERGRGGILLLSSVFAYQGVPYFANYAASKAYILSLGEALNVELKPKGVDVTVVSPGLTLTSMVAKADDIDFDMMPVTKHHPIVVATTALRSLGKKATVVPGLLNKIYAWQTRLMPRSWPTRMFGYLVRRASLGNKENEKKETDPGFQG